MTDAADGDRGLPNFGHTCYVNAALQAIFPLLNAFLSPESVAGVCEHDVLVCVIMVIMLLLLLLL